MTHPLVFIPGIGSDAAVWADMPSAEVIVSSSNTIVGMAQDMLSKAPARFALAGHSMGGYIALAMTGLAPERISRLALISTSAAPDTDAQQGRRLKLIEQARQDFAAVARLLAPLVLSPGNAGKPELVAEAEAMMLRCGQEMFVRQQEATLRRPDLRSIPGGIAVPTLVLHGCEDRIVPIERGDELAQAIPGAIAVRLSGCGHMPTFEDTQATKAALLDWLSAHD